MSGTIFDKITMVYDFREMKMRILLFNFLLLASLIANAQSKPVLSPEAMKEDFNYLRVYLETTHPMLYLNYGKEAMKYKMDSLAETMDRPMPFLMFYKKIANLMAMVGCEHSSCSYGKGFDKFLQSTGFFPYQLYFSPDRVQVLVNLTSDQDIQPGDEVVSINNQPIDSIRRELYRCIPSDGWIESSKDAQLSGMSFSIWYHLFIDQAKEFKVSFRTMNGKLITKTVKAVKMDKLNQQAFKNPVNKQILELSQRLNAERKEKLRVELLPDMRTAVLTVSTFVSDMVSFRKELDSCFKLIAGNEKLIINLCNNGGGEVELAADLLAYFITSPTSIVEHSYLITDKDEDLRLANIPDEVRTAKYNFIEPLANGKSYTKLSKYAGELKMLQPRQDRFAGKVYLLVNGGTASAASTFTAVMKSLKLAKVVGQETAGGYTGGGTAIGLDLTLPNSKITVHSGLIYQRFRTTGGTPNRGVEPDINFVATLADLIADNRPWLNLILEDK